MLLLRKIDCYGQLAFAGVMIVSWFVLLNAGGFVVGLFFLGCWQVLSAIFNTHSFTQCGFTRRILLYWILCLTDLVMAYLSYWLELHTGHVVAGILFFTSVIVAFAIAGYYWWIYYKLIGFIFLRNELDGLTKSKH